MQFQEWPLDWHDYLAWRRRIGQRPAYKNQEEFYRGRAQEMKAQHNWVSVRDEAEQQWLSQGSPYYNIHPQLVEKLCRVNLDKVPAHLVELPHDFTAVNLRLAQQHPELTLQDDVPITAEVSWVPRLKTVPVGSWLHSMLMIRPTKRMLDAANIPMIQPPEKLALFLFDFNVVNDDMVRSWGIGPLLWTTEQDTLSHSLLIQHLLGKQASPAYSQLIANCMRLAVTIGFMSNSNDELIEPDVLSKDRFEFDRTADKAKRQTIIDRAHRRGKKGWNVGNDLMFLETSGHATTSRGASGEGRELRWAHIRSGHPHAVRYGPKHGKVKIKWFRPTVVRPDLGFQKD